MAIIGGTEIRVNSYTAGQQSNLRITTLSGGGWIVTWMSEGQDGSSWGVYQQAYNADGSALGGEVRINSYVAGNQQGQQITALADGGWVVTWVSVGQDGMGWDSQPDHSVYQQAYNANGSARGGEVRVHAYWGVDETRQQITALADGGWVVTWDSWGDGYQFGVSQQAFNANGSARGDQVRLNSYTNGNQYGVKIAALSGGGWVVSWQSEGQDGSGNGIYQRVYNADGSARGDEVRVNSYVTGNQFDPRVTALSDGGWVVTWGSDGQDGSGWGGYQQAYNADGSARGGEVRVNSHVEDDQYVSQVMALADGGWVVLWVPVDAAGNGHGVYQQAYNADGSARGGEVRVNSHGGESYNYKEAPQITALADGGWVVTWQSKGQEDDDGEWSSYGVYQQVYNADGSARGGEIHVNSYQEGDQKAPQITALADGGWVVTWQSDGQDGSSSGVYQRVFHFGSVGTAGDDYIIATDDFENLVGGEGDDYLIGAGSSSLFGDEGNDHLVGTGSSSLRGGEGNDFYVTNDGDLIVELEDHGIDTVRASGAHSYTLGANLENLEIRGNVVEAYGNSLDNVIEGNGHNNTLSGGTGNDTLIGYAGSNDTFITDGGDTIIDYSSVLKDIDTVQSSVSYTLGAHLENLTLTGFEALNGDGNSLDNVLIGNDAANRLDGKTGTDRLAGGLGNDTYVTDGGDAIVEGYGEGTDTVRSSVSYTLGAHLDNLTLTGFGALNGDGNTLNNVLTGNGGNNILNGGAGYDKLIGGAGNDTYVLGAESDTVSDSAGIDTITSAISRSLAGNATIENLTLLGSGNINATGNALANTLTGNSGNNMLDGGAGKDKLIGGAGNDTYVLGSESDTVTDSAGIDTITSTISRSLAGYATIENLTLLGSGNINANGNALANTLTGNSGNNTLNGGAGKDKLIGGAGNDTYVLGSESDTVTDSAGIDTITSTISRSLAGYASIENLTLLGSGNIKATGNALANTLTGNAGNNTLDGGTGKDKLVGGAGNDYYLADGAETIIESANAGTDTVETRASFTLAANVENLVLTGLNDLNGTGNSGSNNITGNMAANILKGEAGNDALTGFDGNDTLSGGLGKDALSGGSGKDTFIFNTQASSTNIDIIDDFSVADAIQLENSVFAAMTKTGKLASTAFARNASGLARDKDDRVIYETDTGKLFYDADGNGKGAAIQFAILSKGLALTYGDFFII